MTTCGQGILAKMNENQSSPLPADTVIYVDLQQVQRGVRPHELRGEAMSAAFLILRLFRGRPPSARLIG